MPPSDQVVPTGEPEKKPNPFRFTRFTWGNSASTKIFGVGGSYIGTEDEQFTMDFTLGLRYYVIDKPLDTMYVGATVGWTTELTNSDTTTKEHEVLFRDVSLNLGYGHTVYENADKSLKITPVISTSESLPTSEASRTQGKYLTTNLTGGLVAGLPLAGPKSDWFPDILAFGTVTWQHLFSRATQPTNANLHIPRQVAPTVSCDRASGNCDGDSYFGDQLANSAFAHDVAKLNFTYYLTIYKDLSFGNTWGIDLPSKYKFSTKGGCDVSTSTSDCVTAQNIANVTSGIPVTTFDVSFSYLIYDTVRLDLGYVNTSGELGEDGKRRSIFFSPDATFYGNVAIYIDNIIEKVRTPKATRTATQRFTNPMNPTIASPAPVSPTEIKF